MSGRYRPPRPVHGGYMKAIHVLDGQHVTMTRGSIVLVFDPKEIDVAIYDLELLACMLEERMREQCRTDELWEVASQLRCYKRKHGH